ncbi:hypothetical protein [Streptomyces bacillaris]|uniref:hypothetical protein n=1 Tax=Streptomyces bacillaris TaxID=68179 RepID=UPI00362B814B
MNVNDIVAEKIEAARRKSANNKRRREELAEARRHGLARRHAQKLAHLARAKQPLTSLKEVSEETTVLPPPKGAADNSGPSGPRVMGETPTTPLTSQHPTRARGTGHEPDAFRRAGMHGNGEIDE